MLNIIRPIGRSAAAAGLAIGCLAMTAGTAGAASASSAQMDYWGSMYGPTTPGPGATDVPVGVNIPDDSGVAQVATSNTTSYALMRDGSVWSWGRGSDGQLGDGGTDNSMGTPIRVDFPAGVDIASLAPDAMPYSSALAIDTRGNAWGWGANNDGQLCLGDEKMRTVPVELPFSDVTATSGAGGHALYVAGSTLYACGLGAQGALGDGSTKSSTRPAAVSLPGGAVPATPVTAYQDSGVITTNGAYYTWGRNNLGQLGIGSQTAYSDVPRQVTFADAKGQRDTSAVVAVYLGGSEPYNGQTAVELSGGSWWAFGDNSYGQLADGTSKNAFSPQSLTTPAGTVAVASGGGALYALTDEGDVWSVGQGYLGELGDGSYRNSPTWVLADSGVRSVSTTASNVSVLRGRQVSPLRPGLGG